MNNISKIIIVGAGCPLADAIAEIFYNNTEIIGISARQIQSSKYNEKLIFDFLDENQTKKELSKLTDNIDSFVVVTCTGRFPLRKKLSDYKEQDDLEVYTSNVLGFVIPYRATIFNARKATNVAYITFGSVSQMYKYPKLSVFTAAKDALRALVVTASHEESTHNVKFIHLNLSTLDQEKELCFTSNQAGRFLPCNEVALTIHNLLNGLECMPYFSEYFIYKHSDAYYNEGYYSRIPEENKG